MSSIIKSYYRLPELVQCSTTSGFSVPPKSEVRLQMNSLFQNTGIHFPRKAVECDPSVVGAHPLVPLLKEGNHQYRGNSTLQKHNLQHLLSPPAAQ